jgi:uncharacterized surface protein with fasciclin (FAS1) repeats
MTKCIGFLSVTAIGLLILTVGLVPSVHAQDKRMMRGEMSGEKTVMVGGAAMFPSKNIIQNAVNSKDHTTLVAAVKAAGLVDTLEGKGPFTVFAPTNEAFGKLASLVDVLVKPESKATLTDILTYHVVPGRLEASSLTDGKKLKTIEGEELTVRILGGKVMLFDSNGGASTVTIANVNQSNGIIHVVDRVLFPRFDVASSDKNIPIPSQKLDDFFPWPPITPTVFYRYPQGVLNPSKKTSLRDLSERFDRKLNSQGYSDRYYFSQRSGNGFVVLTRMERIELDGKSAKQERWTSDVKLKTFSIADLGAAILGQRIGHFRVIALVVTQDSRPPTQRSVTMDLLKLWQSQGQPTLPKGYDKIPFGDDHNVYALIYEFARTIDSEKPIFVEQSKLSATDHLAGAGLSAEDLK